MNIGYFIDPSATPVTSAVLAGVKSGGGTEVYIRVKNADYKNHASELALVKAAGLKPFAWIWQGFSYTKEMVAAGWNIVMDMETYSMANYVSEIKNIRSLTSASSKTFILCTKAQAWDGEQSWSTIVPLCDYIMPMLYLGDYGKTVEQLTVYAKTYSALYPGKFYPALETYVSDTNVVAKNNDVITAEIEACRPYCKGVGLFRYGLSNYKPEVIIVATQKQLTSGTVTLAVFQDMIKRFNAYVTKYGTKPAFIFTVNGGTDYVTLNYYGIMAYNYVQYQKAYGKKPSTIEITTTKKTFSTTTSGWQLVPSYKMDYQDTGYTCGPTSLSMGFTELFPGSGSRESQLASWAGTTTSGTGHSGLEKAFLKQCEALGVKGSYSEVGLYEMSQTELGKLLVDPDVFVIAHGDTAGWSEGGWINSYGHYVYPIGVNLTTRQYKIADPTKGVVTYSKSGFESGLQMISQKSFLIFKVTR